MMYSRWLTPGIVLGVGLGGFLDGIALHQIAQWHNMGSAILPPTTMHAMSQNMVWDGLFHAATWTITLLGVYMLWADRRVEGLVETPGMFTGQLLFGWGAFNLVEGVIDHQLLGIHHVRDDLGGPLGWDLGFLALGAALVAAGWALTRRPT
jgi:uncharacterized membrane protein